MYLNCDQDTGGKIANVTQTKETGGAETLYVMPHYEYIICECLDGNVLSLYSPSISIPVTLVRGDAVSLVKWATVDNGHSQ